MSESDIHLMVAQSCWYSRDENSAQASIEQLLAGHWREFFPLALGKFTCIISGSRCCGFASSAGKVDILLGSVDCARDLIPKGSP